MTSFLTIGVIWINHHHCVTLIARVDRPFLFINTLLLLVVSFIPFPTKLVAQYLQKPGEQSAVLAYTATLLLMAVLYNLWWRYARRNRRLIGDRVADSSLRAVDRAFDPGVPAYAIVLAIAFVSPLASVIITLCIAAFYLPSAALWGPRLNRLFEPRRAAAELVASLDFTTTSTVGPSGPNVGYEPTSTPGQRSPASTSAGAITLSRVRYVRRHEPIGLPRRNSSAIESNIASISDGRPGST